MFPRDCHNWTRPHNYCSYEAANEFNICEEPEGVVHGGSRLRVPVTIGAVVMLWILVTAAILVWIEKRSDSLGNTETRDGTTAPRQIDGVDVVLPRDGALPVRSSGDAAGVHSSDSRLAVHRTSPRVPHPEVCTPRKTNNSARRLCRCLDPHVVRFRRHVLYFCLTDTFRRKQRGAVRRAPSARPIEKAKPSPQSGSALLVAV